MRSASRLRRDLAFFTLAMSLCWYASPTPILVHAQTAEPNPNGARRAQQLRNAEAFTRLFGYVRFFHPSYESFGRDWNQVASNGMQAVLSARDDGQLSQRLAAFFAPIAPTVRVYTSASVPPLPNELRPPSDASTTVVMWHHRGVYLGNDAVKQVYNSERVSKRLVDGTLPEGFHDPRKPLSVTLVAGVFASLPTALFEVQADDTRRTLPVVNPDVYGTIDKTAEPPNSQTSRRLSEVTVVWTVMQHFYPYFDVVKTDWDAALTRALSDAVDARDEQQFILVLRRLLAQLHDGHASVYGHDQAALTPSVTLTDVDDQIVVLDAQGIADDKLRPGDVIVSIDGVGAKDALLAQEALISSPTPQWRRWVALQSVLGGAALKPAKLEVRSAKGQMRKVEVQRRLNTSQEKRPKPATELEPGIWYVDLERASESQLDVVIPKLAQARGIVFDMRGYPTSHALKVINHLTDKPVTSAQWHTPLVTLPDRKDMTFERDNWTLEPEQPRFRAKVAFLTDGRAISYAETYMGIIEAYRLGEIVGGPTAGTNGNVNPFKTISGYWVSWTGMKVLKHDGSRHHGVGIQPTVPATRTVRGIAEGREEQLERALEVVKGK